MTLIMFQYCPSCGETNIRFKGNKFSCPDCGFIYFHNTAAATGCVIETGEKVVLLVRGREPGLGKLDLPGGFVDPGEGVLEGLLRELREELGWEPPALYGPEEPVCRFKDKESAKPLAEVFTLFASFPNTYLYKGIAYNTCDMYFTVSAPGLAENDICPEAGEISDVRFLRPEEINLDDMAFESTRRAIEAYRKLSQQ